MPIRIQCPGCQKTLKVADNLAGKRVLCPACKVPVQLPAAATAGASGAGPMPVSRPPAKTGSVPKAAPAVPPPDLEDLAAASLGLGAEEKKEEGDGAGNGQAVAGKPITFNCFFCDAEVTVEAAEAGKRIPCPECSKIIEVPKPKADKPKDWRDTKKAGPSGAKDNLLPEKPDDAWGTETKKNVSQKALEEAGVAPPPKVETVPVFDRVVFWIKAGVVVAVCFFLSYGIYRAGADKRNEQRLESAEADFVKRGYDKKWGAVIQAEFYQGLAEQALRQGKAEKARERFLQARQKALEAKDPKDRIDAEFFLIRLAVAEVGLGGDADQVNNKQRFDWNQQEFYLLVQSTLGLVDDPLAKLEALAEVGAELGRREKAPLAVNLFNSLRPPEGKKNINMDPALRAAAAQQRADAGKWTDVVAEQKKGNLADAPARFAALMTVATGLALDPADGTKSETAREARAMAAKLLEKEAKDKAPPWAQLELIRLTAREDPEAAKAFVRFKDKAFEQRAKFDLIVVPLETKPPGDASAALDELQGDAKMLAWLGYARASMRKLGHLPTPPDDDLRFLVSIAQPQPATPVVAAQK